MMNISMLSRLLCMVSKERNMDGFSKTGLFTDVAITEAVFMYIYIL